MRVLVVPSETVEPLCTSVAVPTDGLPEWGKCSDCGLRLPPPMNTGSCPSCDNYRGRMLPDGPFPFTVARWAEVERPGCPARVWDEGTYAMTCDRLGEANVCLVHGPYLPRKVGAIVELVEVTGPSHHADECHIAAGWGIEAILCHPDASPDCWHTPTSTVHRLDVPIPMDRPYETEASAYSAEHGPPWTPVPAPWWWADLDLEVPA